MQKANQSYGSTLFVAIDLGGSRWRLAFSDGKRAKPRGRTVPARDVIELMSEVDKAKRRMRMPPSTPVSSCYEAGRDGFWLHRVLTSQGIDNVVVDPGSVEVNRRARRAKTDRIDAEKLVSLLILHARGEANWSLARVPSPEEEDARRVHRELRRLNKERTSLRCRIHSVLALEGLATRRFSKLGHDIDVMRRWDDSPLLPRMKSELQRDAERLALVELHIRQLRDERDELIDSVHSPVIEKVRLLESLRGIGRRTAWLLVMEFFAWRKFRNRGEVGALAGLTGTPHNSDGVRREQGISKAGNKHVRGLMIEIAWCWLKYQPDSALSKWFNERYGRGTSRSRRVGIVALARKLLIALWRFVEQGLVPTSAELKPLRKAS
jgi:transposase